MEDNRGGPGSRVDRMKQYHLSKEVIDSMSAKDRASYYEVVQMLSDQYGLGEKAVVMLEEMLQELKDKYEGNHPDRISPTGYVE